MKGLAGLQVTDAMAAIVDVPVLVLMYWQDGHGG